MRDPAHLWRSALGAVGVLALAASAGAEPGEAPGTAAAAGKGGGALAYQRVSYARAPSAARRGPSPLDRGAYAREIAEAAALYAVPERLIWAVIRVESGFNPRAVSPKGARGLMQLMPQTAAILGVRNAFDSRENIRAGTRHLRAMMVTFPHDLRLAVAAYNAGVKPVAAHRGVPPYPETRQYVRRVLRFYRAPGERAPGERRPAPARGVYRLVRPDGTIVYTNIPYGRLAGR